ncbi:MAG: hypothetical protein ACUVX8_07790 [Candidatus Zipacnadales bacterium]
MSYIKWLSPTEDEFRRIVAEIEADPLFTELRALGVVCRCGGRAHATNCL